MDYYLFWEAFSAIGTTLGSIITAIAVIVAVVQYRQPLIKRAKVECASCYPVDTNGSLLPAHVSISIENVGIRNIKVEMFYLLKGNKKFFLTNIQSELLPKAQLPFILTPEDKLTLYMPQDIFDAEMKRLSIENKIPRFGKMYPIVQDSVGKIYKGKSI